MPKYNVFVVDRASGCVVAFWDRVSRRRAVWLAAKWQKRRISSTVVSVSIARL